MTLTLIIVSLKAEKAKAAGNIAAAEDASKSAKVCNIASVVVGLMVLPLIIYYELCQRGLLKSFLNSYED